jgi:hypothetical protein
MYREILVGELLGRLRSRWGDNIKISLREYVVRVGGGCNWLRIVSIPNLKLCHSF